MKKSIFQCLLVFILYFYQLNGYAQNGNEWINYNQTYFKIPCVQKGIYRITQAELSQAGISGINPKHLQIFHRGREQSIFVEGEQDNVLNSGDYLEFYGQGNDGFLDAQLYNGNNVVNRYYNLFSDTTAYFLTWTIDQTLGKRMQNSQVLFQNSTIEPYHWKEELTVLAESFSTGQNYNQGNEQLYDSKFDRGEGWMSNSLSTNATRNFSFNVINPYSNENSTALPKLELMLVGTVEGINYTVEVRVGNATNNLRLLQTLTRSSHTIVFTTNNLQKEDFIGTGSLIVQLKVTQGSAALANARILYPQNWTMNGTDSKYFQTTQNFNDTSYVQISNPPVNAVMYDLTDTQEILKIQGNINNNLLEATILKTSTTNPRRLLVHNNIPLSVLAIKAINFANISPANFNYLIITHKNLQKPAGSYADVVQAYADYRASEAGGNFNPLVIDIDLLYNQFSYGETTPLAIRNFARWMYQNGTPKYIFLMGKGASLPDGYNTLNIRQNPQHFALNLVPTYGFPPSDIALVSGLGNNHSAVEPNIPIGRLAAIAPQQILNYLEKVIEHENTAPAIWQKNILHLGGGFGANEINLFQVFLNQFKSIAEGNLLSSKVKSYFKQGDTSNEFVDISEDLNRGVSMITYFGHGSVGATDLNFGNPALPNTLIANQGKYPFIFANACQLGSIFYAPTNISQDWLLTPQKGAIAIIAHTYLGYSNPLGNYTQQFYNKIFKDPNWIGKPIGDLQKEHIRSSVSLNAPFSDRATAQQMILQGDPAIRFIKVDKPDYEISPNQINLLSKDGELVTALTDTFNLKVVVSNLGTSNNVYPSQLKLKRTFPNGAFEIYNLDVAPISYQDTLTFKLAQNPEDEIEGVHQFELIVDESNQIEEGNENNNQAILTYEMGEPNGLEDFSYAVNIFPNPSDGLLAIQTENQMIEEIILIDNLGTAKLKLKNTNPSNIFLVDFSSLTNGFYILKMKSQQGIAYKKVLIRK